MGGVHELVVAVAARFPDVVAVSAPEGCVTYRELVGRAGRLAAVLGASGVGAESVVGLCLERGAEMVVAMLAVWLAGGAYLPLDPGYPGERLEFMLADSGAGVVVGNRAVRGDVPGGAAVVWLDDRAVREAVAAAVPAVPVAARPLQLAYVMYTSGSTGLPKGVGVCHGDVAALVAPGDFVAVGPGDVVGQVATFSFDAATFEVWGALARGASVAVAAREVLLSPRGLSGEVRRRGVSVMFLTAAVFGRVAAEVPGGLRSVRDLIVGGEAVTGGSVRRVAEAGPSGAAAERVRADGGDDVRAVARGNRCHGRGGPGGASAGGDAGVRAGPGAGAGPGGGGRGAVRRGGGGGAWLPGAAGADGGAFRG